MPRRQKGTEVVSKALGADHHSRIVLAGFDFRFGWTNQRFVPVPTWLVLAGQVGVVAGYWVVFWVMTTNTFAASTIRVESGQTVIETGPPIRWCAIPCTPEWL